MFGRSYSEVYYTDIMKTLCSFLNRLDEKKGKSMRHIVRDVKYGSSQYHYIEKVGDVQTYEIADKSPGTMIKQIIERANERLF